MCFGLISPKGKYLKRLKKSLFFLTRTAFSSLEAFETLYIVFLDSTDFTSTTASICVCAKETRKVCACLFDCLRGAGELMYLFLSLSLPQRVVYEAVFASGRSPWQSLRAAIFFCQPSIRPVRCVSQLSYTGAYGKTAGK